MAKTYNLQAPGVNVAATRKGSQYLVDVNGQPYGSFKVGTTSFWLGHNEDFLLNVDDRQIILAIRGNKVRLAENYVFVDNGAPFEPMLPLPGWSVVFIVLCVLIPIVSLGGAINVIIGLLAAAGCASVARKRMGTGAKVGLCIGITLAAYAVWIGFAMMVSGIMY